jgi:hypothetical protein
MPQSNPRQNTANNPDGNQRPVPIYDTDDVCLNWLEILVTRANGIVRSVQELAEHDNHAQEERRLSQGACYCSHFHWST